mgnify:CR=1 FL=1
MKMACTWIRVIRCWIGQHHYRNPYNQVTIGCIHCGRYQ